ncbi:putative quinol monooxygenase [Halotalea alkalilenta]|uniref:putative quinol monooxygenase n=1 Tax=Halotalea alkalilenta TaxID=376489 RepID=UPI00047F2B2F|nr:putative quinol monooxygenase [Halotalea alkalilenta]
MSASRFVVIAEFDLKPQDRERFLELAREDARASVANEPGCHQFDLLISEEDPNLVVLHEVYDDRAAFESHLQMPHYIPFRDGSESMVTDKRVHFFHT